MCLQGDSFSGGSGTLLLVKHERKKVANPVSAIFPVKSVLPTLTCNGSPMALVSEKSHSQFYLGLSLGPSAYKTNGLPLRFRVQS